MIITVSNTQGVYDDANNITYEYGVSLDGENLYAIIMYMTG